jgi:hypothetical protein
MKPSFASSGPPKTTPPSSISSPEWYAPPSHSPRRLPHPPQYDADFSSQPTVAVWAYVMGCGILVLGIFLLFENCAAENKSRAARDQIRTLILLLTLFGISWWFAGNAWSESAAREGEGSAGSGRGHVGDPNRAPRTAN